MGHFFFCHETAPWRCKSISTTNHEFMLQDTTMNMQNQHPLMLMLILEANALYSTGIHSENEAHMHPRDLTARCSTNSDCNSVSGQSTCRPVPMGVEGASKVW